METKRYNGKPDSDQNNLKCLKWGSKLYSQLETINIELLLTSFVNKTSKDQVVYLQIF